MYPPKNVCLITGGFTDKNYRLQPWRYLSEVADQLAGQGHRVTVVTDGGAHAEEQRDALTVRRIPSINRFHWQNNQALQVAVQAANPDVILWHLGLPSFVHQRFDGWPNVPILGLFPGLVYRPQELLRLGIRRIARGYRLSAIHVVGTLVPKRLVCKPVTDGRLACLVTQTRMTSQRLLESGLSAEQVRVIPPGVDEVWSRFACNGHPDLRERLGYKPTDNVVLYFGSPAPLRGLHTLVRALGILRTTDPSFKLLVLNRRRRDELLQEDAELRQLLNRAEIGTHVQVISGFLAPDDLSRHVAACDVVALPFELVPADAPLSLLEAQALGKPVVTTRVASLPEMVAPGTGYLAEPADPASLAQALQQAVVDLRAGGQAPRQSGAQFKARSWQEVGEEWSHLIHTL